MLAEHDRYLKDRIVETWIGYQDHWLSPSRDGGG